MEQSSNPGLDKQILSSLERISEAFRVLLWEQGKSNGLSPIQIQFLIFTDSHRPEKSTVSYLAEEFNLTKATVSESVKVLINKGLLVKHTNVKDTRSFSLALTLKGKEIADNVASFSRVFSEVLGAYSNQEKENFYSVLHGLIKGLNTRGIISVQRNCASCRFYNNNGSHFCTLLQLPLMAHELRTDCVEHEPNR